MTDAMTEKRLSISTDGDAGPYIEVTVSQLDDLRDLLDGRGVRYYVQDLIISFDGGPEIAVAGRTARPCRRSSIARDDRSRMIWLCPTTSEPFAIRFRWIRKIVTDVSDAAIVKA